MVNGLWLYIHSGAVRRCISAGVNERARVCAVKTHMRTGRYFKSPSVCLSSGQRKKQAAPCLSGSPSHRHNIKQSHAEQPSPNLSTVRDMLSCNNRAISYERGRLCSL